MAQIKEDVRPSPIAGQWYPGNPQVLASSIDQMIAAASPVEAEGHIIGLVVPHAGHQYSGHIAAQAFRLIQGKPYQRVIVIAPMHHLYHDPVLTSEHTAYQTPLGKIPVDQAFLHDLNNLVPLSAVRNDPEHSLEIELPFLQRVLAGSFSLVPLMLRSQTIETADRLGRALAQLIGEDRETLLVASSDLSHFYPDHTARQLDEIMLGKVLAFDPAGVIRVEDEGRAFACGRAAIATLLIASRELGADTVSLAGYATSADATGDRRRVVGYGAAVVYRKA
jgi:hypothetical protein